MERLEGHRTLFPSETHQRTGKCWSVRDTLAYDGPHAAALSGLVADLPLPPPSFNRVVPFKANCLLRERFRMRICTIEENCKRKK